MYGNLKAQSKHYHFTMESNPSDISFFNKIFLLKYLPMEVIQISFSKWHNISTLCRMFVTVALYIFQVL